MFPFVPFVPASPVVRPTVPTPKEVCHSIAITEIFDRLNKIEKIQDAHYQMLQKLSERFDALERTCQRRFDKLERAFEILDILAVRSSEKIKDPIPSPPHNHFRRTEKHISSFGDIEPIYKWDGITGAEPRVLGEGPRYIPSVRKSDIRSADPYYSNVRTYSDDRVIGDLIYGDRPITTGYPNPSLGVAKPNHSSVQASNEKMGFRFSATPDGEPHKTIFPGGYDTTFIPADRRPGYRQEGQNVGKDQNVQSAAPDVPNLLSTQPQKTDRQDLINSNMGEVANRIKLFSFSSDASV